MKAHIATCVAIGQRGVLIEGPPGSGKSALALALMDRGARLVGDDGTLLAAINGQLIAAPHPNTRGQMEIRNLGIIPFEVCDEIPIALIIALDGNAPRFIEAATVSEREGITIPQINIWPESNPPALKVEHALRIYGLPE